MPTITQGSTRIEPEFEPLHAASGDVGAGFISDVNAIGFAQADVVAGVKKTVSRGDRPWGQISTFDNSKASIQLSQKANVKC
jgi:hypothetical protein